MDSVASAGTVSVHSFIHIRNIGQCKVSVYIGNDTVVGSFLYDAGADKRLSRHIPYHTFDCFGFLRTGTSCKQKRQCHNHTT